MADINRIKMKILEYHEKIVCIQRACRQRKLSLRNRKAFLKVYWQRVKLEMQSMLFTNKEYTLKMVSMSDSIRDKILQQYAQYMNDRFTLKFLEFRQKLADHRGE